VSDSSSLSFVRRAWRSCDELQRRRWFRYAVSALFAVVVLGYAGATWMRADAIRREGDAIFEAIRGGNLVNKDAVAVELAEKGTVTVGGRTFGDSKFAPVAKSFYDADGNLTNPGAAVRMLIDERLPTWAPTFLLQRNDTLAILTVAVLGLLLIAVWTGLSIPLFVAGALTVIVCTALGFLGGTAWVIAVASIVTLLFAFATLVRGAAVVLGRPQPIFAIAANVLREAVRLKTASFFVVVLLVAIPLLPLWIDDKEPLRYQIQSFLARSMGLQFLLAACMTVFLSSATVAFEIRDRQIWQLMVKPVARLQYLVGKWLGVIALNLILAVLGGVAIFTYVQYLQTRTPKDAFDMMAVREEVLVARDGRLPRYVALTGTQAREIVETKLAADTLLRAEIESGERTETEVLRELARQVHQEHLANQRNVPPGPDGREFVFEDLLPAKRMNATMTLRYAFDIASIDPHTRHPVIFEFPNTQPVFREFTPAQAHVLAIPPTLIDDDGTLKVKIINGGPGIDQNGNQVIIPGVDAIRFKGDQFEVLYRVDTFEWNFVRAMMVQFVKLSFLAMFGVCAAAVLSFPVACMLCFTILVIGSMVPFLGISLSEYRIAQDAPAVWRAFQMAVKLVASAAEATLREFGQTTPTASLVEGRVISWTSFFRTLLVIGGIWTGATLAAGFFAFRKKELATYSGNT
jgi:ABC-type transport system involved in multi-copper enzyme maturation permease subunit